MNDNNAAQAATPSVLTEAERRQLLVRANYPPLQEEPRAYLVKITEELVLSKLRAPVASAEVMDALNWVDDFIARCNRDDRGSCESVNVLRRALASAPVNKPKRAPLDDWRVQAIAECLETEWDDMTPASAEADARLIVGYLIEYEKESDRIEAQHAAEPVNPVVQAVRNLRASAPVSKPLAVSEDFAHEVWAAAQSPHGEPMEKSVARVASLLAEASAPVAGEAQQPAKITFVNGNPASCGCTIRFSDGGGEYSDVHYVSLCGTHSGAHLLSKVIKTGELTRPQHEDLEGEICAALDPAGSQATNAAPQSSEAARDTSDMDDLRSRVLAAIHDCAALTPEDDESWDEWYCAAFDLLGSRVGEIFRVALSAQPADKPAISSPSSAGNPCSAPVPAYPQTGKSHTDGGAVYG